MHMEIDLCTEQEYICQLYKLIDIRYINMSYTHSTYLTIIFISQETYLQFALSDLIYFQYIVYIKIFPGKQKIF